MRKILHAIVFLILVAVQLPSQNYKMVNANSEYFFLKNNSFAGDTVVGLKCDSTQGNIFDSIYFPYRTIARVGPMNATCNVDPNFPIWAGKKIVVDNNNRHKWETLSGDSVIIKSQTPIGDTQVIYIYANGNKIIGIHSSNTLLTFATLTDSVQHFILQIVNPSNNIVPGFWNGKEITISKNNGVVQMPAIRNFPNDTAVFSRVYAKRLTFGDCYPWQVGDELHENRHSYSQMSFYYSDWFYNKRILSRTMINADSVVFTIQRITHYTSNGPPANTLTIDTITLRVGHLSSYIENGMPQQTRDSLLTYDLFFRPSDCGKLRMVDHVQNANVLDMNNNCITEDDFEPMFHDNIYIDGVSGYYFYDFPSAQNSGTSDDFHNTYFSIASTTCGTPVYLGNQEITEGNFHSWPNPTNDFLNFDLPSTYSNFTLEIFDCSGKEIQTVALEKNIPVDVRFLANGFYLGKISSKDGNFQQNIRFVKN